MNNNHIYKLLEKYWNCETSVQEEKELQYFFSISEIPEDLLQYSSLFTFINKEQTISISKDFEDNLLKAIEQNEKNESQSSKKYITIKIFTPLLRVAASILLIFGLGISIFFVVRQNNKPKFVETYQDPNAAIKHATFALQKLSDAIRLSETASMQTIQVIDELNIDWHLLDSLANIELVKEFGLLNSNKTSE